MRHISAFLILSAATSAIAQESTQEVVHDRTEIDFDEVSLTAELDRPNLTHVFETRRVQFNPLIRLRQHFDAEIASSVDEVK
jgi:hypothetical protein